MTTAADDSADEIAFEAFLAGRPVPAEADGGSPVAAFAGAVRATATVPGRPNAALAELLATGLLADQSSPSIRTAPSAGSTPRRSRIRRRRFAMFLPALVAKFLSLSAVAQAASGVGIAVVAFTGAGATGMLGDDVQTSLTSVVGAADATSDVSTPVATPTETPATETPEVETPAAATPSPAVAAFDAKLWAAGPTGAQTFGEWVSQGAHNKAALAAAARARGEVFRFGQVVSSRAHEKHIDLSEVEGIEDVEGIDDSASSTATHTATHTAEVETEHSTEDTHGGGNSGHGGGNSGRGHN
jgi:hypothetical protein